MLHASSTLAPIIERMNRNPSTSRVLAVSALLLAWLSILLACDEDAAPAPEPDRTPPPSPAVAATPTSPPRAAPAPEATRDLDDLPPYAAWIVHVATGEMTEIHSGYEPGVVGAWTYQGWTPSGTGIWLSYLDEDRAIRYDLGGTPQDEIDGGTLVIESAGGARAFVVPRERDGPARIGVERADGERFEVDGTLWLLAFAPDDRHVAYWIQRREDEGLKTLMLLDLEDGSSRELVSDVGPRESDPAPVLRWSPSGRFIRYGDHGQWHPTEGGERRGAGTYLYDLEADEAIFLTPRGAHHRSWLPDRDITAFTREGEALLYDAVTGEETVVMEGDRITSASFDPSYRLLIVHEASRAPEPREPVTTAFDLETGDEVGRWDGSAGVRSAPGGLAVSLRPNERVDDCAVLHISDPRLNEPLCFGAVTGPFWSPNAHYFAYVQRGTLHLIDLEAGEARELGEVPRQASIEWHPEGTHLLIRWPSWAF